MTKMGILIADAKQAEREGKFWIASVIWLKAYETTTRAYMEEVFLDNAELCLTRAQNLYGKG